MAANVDFDEINKFIKLLDEKNLTEFELEVEGFKIKLARRAPAAPVFAAPSAHAPAPSSAANNPAAFSAEPAEIPGSVVHIASPMVGTFYRAPAPNAPPFVEVGETVGPDTVVAIIETMKLMNPVHAGASGTIDAILFENGAPVDADAVLMTVRPA